MAWLSFLLFRLCWRRALWHALNKCVWFINFVEPSVRRPEYSGRNMLISWLPMAWLLQPPGHQQQWYWLSRINNWLLFIKNDFNHQHHLSFKKWHKNHDLMQERCNSIDNTLELYPFCINHQNMNNCLCFLNSLWPSDTIWPHKSGSTLAQVMACCLMAPSHYRIQCWLTISKVQWHSSECNFTRDTSATSHWN